MLQQELHVVLTHRQKIRTKRLETDEELVVYAPVQHPHAVRVRLPQALAVLLHSDRRRVQELLAQQYLGVVQILLNLAISDRLRFARVARRRGAERVLSGWRGDCRRVVYHPVGFLGIANTELILNPVIQAVDVYSLTLPPP